MLPEFPTHPGHHKPRVRKRLSFLTAMHAARSSLEISGRIACNMKAIIEKYGISQIWHFTDRSNLDSIRKHGLLSFAEAKRRGIEIPCPGGNDWSRDLDKRKGLDEYVNLSFVDDHPMLYWAHQKEKRILDPVWIGIDPSIMLGGDVQFCVGIANKTDMPRLDASEAKTKIDFEVLFPRPGQKLPFEKELREIKKAQILVPHSIPVEKMLEVR